MRFVAPFLVSVSLAICAVLLIFRSPAGGTGHAILKLLQAIVAILLDVLPAVLSTSRWCFPNPVSSWQTLLPLCATSTLLLP